MATFDEYVSALEKSRQIVAFKLVTLRMLRLKKEFGLKIFVEIYSSFEVRKCLIEVFCETNKILRKTKNMMADYNKIQMFSSTSPSTVNSIDASRIISNTSVSLTEDRIQKRYQKSMMASTLKKFRREIRSRI